MATPQPGIVVLGARTHHHLEYDVAADAPTGDIVAALGRRTECFVYHDSHDLTGFIDGTANPPPTEAREVALIAEGWPGAGGSLGSGR